jgi:hypothetical protein
MPLASPKLPNAQFLLDAGASSWDGMVGREFEERGGESLIFSGRDVGLRGADDVNDLPSVEGCTCKCSERWRRLVAAKNSTIARLEAELASIVVPLTSTAAS